MNDINLKVKLQLAKVLIKPETFVKEFNPLFQASSFIVENNYVKQTPVDKGDFKGTIKSKHKNLEYIVSSDVKNADGVRYPVQLYTGTGKFKGAPDFGYTSGRVRAGDVGFGIGGIRPNKVAKRASEMSKNRVYSFLNKGIKTIINKK